MSTTSNGHCLCWATMGAVMPPVIPGAGCEGAIAAGAARNAISGLTFAPPLRQPGDADDLLSNPNLVFVPACDASEPPLAALHVDIGATITVVYSHGNAEDLTDLRPSLLRLSEELNVNILGYDYPGYGLSAGSCCEAACCQALQACVAYLARQDVDRSSIVLMGRSLGSGPAVDVASKQLGFAGLILQSPFLSILRTRLCIVVASSMKDADLFDNEGKISQVDCPVFVLHGSEDSVVPLGHGEELWNRAPNAVRPWWVQGCGHNDVHSHADYELRLAEFLDFVQARQQRQFKEMAAAFAPRMMIRHRPAEKLVLMAL